MLALICSSSSIYIFNKVAYLLNNTLPLTVVLWIMPNFMNAVWARFHRGLFHFFLFFSVYVHNLNLPVHSLNRYKSLPTESAPHNSVWNWAFMQSTRKLSPNEGSCLTAEWCGENRAWLSLTINAIYHRPYHCTAENPAKPLSEVGQLSL